MVIPAPVSRARHLALRLCVTLGLCAPLALGCDDVEPDCALPSAPALTSGTTMLDGEPALIGYADLHTHPGIDRSFDRRLIWGDLCQFTPQVSGDVLPAIEPCPVETHRSHTSDPVERSAHGLILPLLNGQAEYPHAPIGTRAGGPSLDAWPNGRDVLHQGMHVNSIRRAYEGGLRVLFASVTDSQVLSQLLQGPLTPELFRARAEYEEASARAQLARIRGMVRSQSEWMAIARSPAEARAIIESGRLAIILSLEMDALPHEAIRRFIRDDEVRHVVVVHLVDNYYGGTAVTGDVFNASSAYLSELWAPGDRFHYMEVERSDTVLSTLSRPLIGAPGPGGVPVYAELDPLPLSWYRELSYSDTCQCDAGFSGQTSYVELGHLNQRSLSDSGRDLIGELLDGLDVIEDGATRRAAIMVDLSHMDHATTRDAVQVACARAKPLMASHGGVGYAGEPMGQERTLSPLGADYVGRSGGVLGFGTAGRLDEETLLYGAAGPLFTLESAPRSDPARSSACLTLAGSAPGACAQPRSAQAPVALPDAEPISALHVLLDADPALCAAGGSRVAYVEVATTGASPCGSVPAVITRARLVSDAGGGCRADLVAPLNPRVSVDMCSADSPGTSWRWGSVCSASLHWLGVAECLGESGSSATVRSAEVVADTSSGPFTVATLSAPSGAWAAMGGSRSSATLYTRVSPASTTRRAVRVGLTLGPTQLVGAAVTSQGYDVCVRVHACAGAGCVCAPVAAEPPSPDCDPGWSSINLRGSWTSGRLDTYLHLPVGVAPADVCALEVTMLSNAVAQTIQIDEARVESIEDPIGLFAQDYDRALTTYMSSEPGRIAFGTDINGLQVQIPFTTQSPAMFTNGAHGWSARPLSWMRVDGQPLRLEDRGLATYGMLSDLVATLAASPSIDPALSTRINDSIMLSAEQLIRYWERADGTRPVLDTSCTP